MPVAVVSVRQADVPLNGDWVGTLDGYVNAQIQPQVSGYLVRQDYREGSVGLKGAGPVSKSIRVPSRPWWIRRQAQLSQAQAQVAQAEGQVRQAQAQLELAEINVKRDTPLAQARAIAQSQLDTEKQQAQRCGRR